MCWLYELLRAPQPALVAAAAHALAAVGWHDREQRAEIDEALWERLPVLIDAAAAGVCGAVSALALLASTRAAELFAMLQVCVCVRVCDRGRLRL